MSVWPSICQIRELLLTYTFACLFKGIFVAKYKRLNYRISSRIILISSIRPDIENCQISKPTYNIFTAKEKKGEEQIRQHVKKRGYAQISHYSIIMLDSNPKQVQLITMPSRDFQTKVGQSKSWLSIGHGTL